MGDFGRLSIWLFPFKKSAPLIEATRCLFALNTSLKEAL